jgi:hypothetical protein
MMDGALSILGVNKFLTQILLIITLKLSSDSFLGELGK